jgi:hypothetical protein
MCGGVTYLRNIFNVLCGIFFLQNLKTKWPCKKSVCGSNLYVVTEAL